MDDPLRSFFVRWLPAVCQPLGLDRVVDELLRIPSRQEVAETLFRTLRTELPARYGYAALLHPERSIVDFGHRDEVLADLRSWCDSTEPLAWKLLTGPAGRGKTRLAMQLTHELNTADGNWAAGFVDLPAFRTRPELPLLFADVPRDLLLVIDYAERFREEVVAVAAATVALAEFRQDRRVRLIFVARREADLWTEIRRDDRHVGEFLDGGGMTKMALEPIAEDTAGRLAVFREAVQSFARHYGRSPPESAEEPDLSAPEFADVLLTHAVALFHVLGKVPAKPLQRDDILGAIVERERRLWNETAVAKRLPAGLRGAAIQQAATYLTLISLSEGVASRMRAIALLGNCPYLAGVDAPTRGLVADIFHELYPGPGWVNGVTPDLVGTYLLAVSDDDFIIEAFGAAD